MLDVRCFCHTVRLGLGVALGVEGDENLAVDGGVLRAEPVRSLPSRQSLAEELGDEIPNFDKQTGEVIDDQPTDNRGMTEVDEQTARALDSAADRTIDEIDTPIDQQWEGEPEAEYYGPKPQRASAGERWFDRANEKLRYAHETANGIKWYLYAPKDEAPANDGTLSDDNPTAAEGKADEDRGEAQGDDEPVYQKAVNAALAGAQRAKTRAEIKKVDDEWQKHAAVVPDEVAAEVEDAIGAARREINAKEG